MKDHTIIYDSTVQTLSGSSTSLSMGKIDIKIIGGLQEELDRLRAENAQLREWVSYGKYSAK